MRTIGLILGSLVFATPGVCQNLYELTVSTYSGSPVNSSVATELSRIITEKIRYQCGDRTPDIEFVLKEFRPASSDAPTRLDSRDAWDEINRMKVSVYTVKAVTWCDGRIAKSGKFAGCGGRGGPIVVDDEALARPLPNVRLAQLWAHEMGHAQGLLFLPGYSEGHNPHDGTLMYWRGRPQNWWMSKLECGFLNRQIFPVETADSSQANEPAAARSQSMTDADVFSKQMPEGRQVEDGSDLAPPDPPAHDLGQSLEDTWYDGMDISFVKDNAQELGPLARDAIRGDDYGKWANAALVVGYLADEAASELLSKVLASEEPSPLVEGAKCNAVTALGYLANRGDDDAIGVLKKIRQPSQIGSVDPTTLSDTDHREAIEQCSDTALALAGSNAAEVVSDDFSTLAMARGGTAGLTELESIQRTLGILNEQRWGVAAATVDETTASADFENQSEAHPRLSPAGEATTGSTAGIDIPASPDGSAQGNVPLDRDSPFLSPDPETQKALLDLNRDVIEDGLEQALASE